MNKVTLLCTTLLLWGLTNLQADCGSFPDNISALSYFCDEPTSICLDLPLNQLSEYELTLDGQPFFGQIAGCNFDTLYNYSYSLLAGQGNSGPYSLDNWTINGENYTFEFNDIIDLVAQMNSIDTEGNWTLNPVSLLITGGVPSNTYSMMHATQVQNNLPAIIGLSFGFEPKGTQLGLQIGEYELILNHLADECADTIALNIVCYVPSPIDTITNTIAADENPYVACIDTTGLPGNIVSILNVCPDEASGFVNFLIIEDEFCVKYQGVKCNGLAKACIVVCDDLGLCDTTIFQITVNNTLCDLDSDNYNDEILINFSETYCLNTTELPGMVVNMENICDSSTGNVDFDLDFDDFCMTYTGINEGKDTACVVLTDQYGNEDTTFFCINVILPQPQTVVDTILYGENSSICVDISELAGNNLTIFNDCENLSGEAVNIIINEVTLCAEADGIGLATEQACLIICDEFGVCDTTIWIITVADNGDPCALNPSPTTLDDTAETLQNQAVNISILDNDEVPNCSSVIFEMVTSPNNGVAIANNNGTLVNYSPNKNYCGNDEFIYKLCNDNGCDTATVIISVNCIPDDEIKIYNAFSPNGDGMSDFFKIENIENFPNNELKIFNRWGNIVFSKLRYQNTWDGNYQNEMLPDGTYFYQLSIEGKDDVAGWVQIAR